MIYLLISRRITLAKSQSLFIINLSVSDVLVSILGVFRGLGIIDGRFVGVVNNTATPYCAVYILLLSSFGLSNVVALLPLTIDRAVAVILPLRHASLINFKSCIFMFVSGWMSVFIVLVNYLVDYKNGNMVVKYVESYHRCEIFGKTLLAEHLLLFIIPFLLILLMYGSMLFIIVKTSRSCGYFLFISASIIGSNLLCFAPGTISYFGVVKMRYETSQILNVTFWYVNGVLNPIIYLAIHPKTRAFVRKSIRGRNHDSISTI